MVAENPYADQTSTNTSTPWLAGGPAVDVDLDGLREYGRLMKSQQADIGSRISYLAPLSEMPGRAWDGDVLGEADWVRAQLLANAGELSTYLGKLGQSLANVGNAAETVANSYGSGDAVSAARLSDVLFAFGDKNVTRPAGLPEGVGTTYLEAQMAAGAAPPPASSPQWQEGPVTPVSAYQTQQIATGPNGERRETMTFTAPGGAVTTTTTVYDRSGETVSTNTTRTSSRVDGPVSTTTQQTLGPDGKPASTTETRTRVEGDRVVETTTETVDSKGRTTNLTTEQLDPVTRETTTTTYEPGKSGLLEATNKVQVGTRTSGNG